jgi:hypothetical protein
MAAEEDEHRRRLIEVYRRKFGEHIPLMRRQNVRGFVRHDPIWMVRPPGLEKVRDQRGGLGAIASRPPLC